MLSPKSRSRGVQHCASEWKTLVKLWTTRKVLQSFSFRGINCRYCCTLSLGVPAERGCGYTTTFTPVFMDFFKLFKRPQKHTMVYTPRLSCCSDWPSFTLQASMSSQRRLTENPLILTLSSVNSSTLDARRFAWMYPFDSINDIPSATWNQTHQQR